MDVFEEGHCNEVYTKNMVSDSLIKHLLIVYIRVVRNFNKKRRLWMESQDLWLLYVFVDRPTSPSTMNVSLIISSDTRYSGYFTLLYLRDGWVVNVFWCGLLLIVWLTAWTGDVSPQVILPTSNNFH